MTEAQALPDVAPTSRLAYSVEMVHRMRMLIDEEIRQVKAKADLRIAELEQAMRDIEARQVPRPTFHPLLPPGRQGYPDTPADRDPYAYAPDLHDSDAEPRTLRGFTKGLDARDWVRG
ncbi:hypothetical protein [Microtetraspora glauca]|uniref:Uncharacterized protein n=1 Tax=Microtetraspora glauca TaxID=1996 RepID=A0ABV3GA92_MICGL